MRAEVGQRARGRVSFELGERDEVGREAVPEAGHVDESGEGDGIGSSTYTFHDFPQRSRRSKIVSAVLWRMKLVTGRFTTKPDDVAAVQKDRLARVCEGTSLNQWSNTPKPRASALITGTCSGEAGHDLAVFLVGRLPAQLEGEEADVVGDETFHRRHGARRRCVVGRHHLCGVLEAVGLVEHVEQLRVRVLVLLAGVGIRRVHAVGDPVGDDPGRGAVLGPGGYRVGEVLADHPFEGRDVTRPVEAPEEVVERSVLEQHEHHVVHRVVSCRRHGRCTLAPAVAAPARQADSAGTYGRRPLAMRSPEPHWPSVFNCTWSPVASTIWSPPT